MFTPRFVWKDEKGAKWFMTCLSTQAYAGKRQ